MKISFECDKEDNWFIVCPEYEGSLEEMKMSPSAADFLSELSFWSDSITIDLNIEEPTIGDWLTLELISSNEKEGLYKVQSNKPESEIIDLNNIVFRNMLGKYPNKIYCNITDIEIKDFLFW